MFRLPATGLLLLALQTAVSAQPSAHSGSAATLTLEAYVAELNRFAEFLRDAPPAEAVAVSPRVSPRWDVETGTERVAVDMQWLVRGLREAEASGADWSARRERLLGRVVALREHAEDLAAAGSGLPYDSFRSAIDQVLAEPEFQQSAAAGWRERLQEHLGAWLQSVLRGIGFGGIGGRSMAMALAWFAGLTALAGLGVWLVRTLGERSQVVPIGIRGAERRRLSSREWALRALRAFRDGDAREAVRCGYNGALRRLEEEGAWRLDGSRTPREYLRMLEPGDNRGPLVKDLTELFEQVWYGSRMVGRADVDRVSVNLEKLGCLHPSERAI